MKEKILNTVAIGMLGVMLGLGLACTLNCEAKVNTRYEKCMIMCTAVGSIASFVDANGFCVCQNSMTFDIKPYERKE
jgi:hypothetical protein